MIYDLNLNDRKNTIFNYIGCLDIPTKIEFKKGINILVGNNGSGKSTIINLLKYYSFINAEGYSSIELSNNMSNNIRLMEFNPNITVRQDYRYKVFTNISGNELNSDDMFDGINNFQKLIHSKNSSSGEIKIKSVYDMFDTMFTKKVSCMFENSEETLNQNKKIKEYISANNLEIYDERIITILMDEPDQNLDVENIKDIEVFFTEQRPDTQIIASLHNIGLIYNLLKKCDYINWIELTTDYLKKIDNYIIK